MKVLKTALILSGMMVSLSITGTAAISPPMVKVPVEEMERLHEISCRYEELLPQLDILLSNDSIKDSIITSLNKKDLLNKEVEEYIKKDSKIKENEISSLKKAKTFREILIVILAVGIIII